MKKIFVFIALILTVCSVFAQRINPSQLKKGSATKLQVLATDTTSIGIKAGDFIPLDLSAEVHRIVSSNTTYIDTINVLIDGQSNSIGQQSGPYPFIPPSNLKVWNNSNQWIIPKLGEAPFNSNGAYNSGLAYCAELARRNPKTLVRLIVSGNSGMPISYWVSPPYAGIFATSDKVVASGVTVVHRFIFDQGESDYMRTPAQYKADFDLLQVNWRSNSWGKNMKQVIVGLYSGVGQVYGRHNETLKEIASDTSVNYLNIGFASVEGFQTYDQIHFTNTELEELGKYRIYNAFEALPRSLTVPSVLSTNIYNTDGTLTSARTVNKSSYGLNFSGTGSTYFSGGAVYVGSTTSNGSASKLEVNHNTTGSFRAFSIGLTTASAPRFFVDYVTTGSTQQVQFNSAYSSSNSFASFAFLNGNVGIGTTSPSTQLQVNGVITIAALGDKQLQFSRAGGNVFSFEHDAGRLYFYNSTSGKYPFVIQNNSNVGFGTAYPTNKIHIVSESGNPLRLEGLQEGTTTDSILTSNSGVVRRIALNTIATITTNHTVTNENVVLCNNSTNNITITIPNASASVGHRLTITRDQFSTGTVTIQPVTSSNQIQSISKVYVSSTTLGSLGSYGQSLQFFSNGTAWVLLN